MEGIGLKGFACAYLDSVVIFSNSWSEHKRFSSFVYCCGLQESCLPLKDAVIVDYMCCWF